MARGRDDDAVLALLLLFYFVVGVFSDSDLQRAVLEGSVYESKELQRRIKDFTGRLARGLLSGELQS